MKKIGLFVALFILCSCGVFNGTQNDQSNDKNSENNNHVHRELSTEGKFQSFVPNGYKLVWQDEFEGENLLEHREPMTGDGSNYGVYRWGNNEEQYYKSENAFVRDDNLHIVAKREISETEKYIFNYTSARLRTKGKVSTLYGYIEARISLPIGTGMWPAFWMLPEGRYAERGWPTSGEIDIMEARGRVINKIGSTLHSANGKGVDVYHTKDFTFDNATDISDFHCYGVEWKLNVFNFFVDGILFFSVDYSTYQNSNPLYIQDEKSAPFNQEFHILLNLAVGGNYDGNKLPGNDFEESEMLVDYVRIFEEN